MKTRLLALSAAALMVVSSCSSDSQSPAEGPSEDGTTKNSMVEGAGGDALLAGAASRSILPTLDGERSYLDDAPGWPAANELDPNDPGVTVVEFDVGRVDVGNGESDAVFVHDDLLATAVAFQRGDQQAVIVSTDTYMHFAPDAGEIERRAIEKLPQEWADAEILIAATHNHHGPDTAFSINPDWYEQAADQIADAVSQAVENLEPAAVKVGTSTHRYGMTDGRDPLVTDPTLNVMGVDSVESGDSIATIVQWGSHPETTLSWNPEMDADKLAAACEAKEWEGDDCSAEGRYFTADYPGVLRTRVVAEIGGEVAYLNGAIGNQIGPGGAPTWVIDDDHPVGDGATVPEGAEPLTTCDREEYLCRSFAKTESIGTVLADAVLDLLGSATAADPTELTVESETFFTNMTNIGFRVLLADGDLGWQPAPLFTCEGYPSADTCEEAEEGTEEDPILTPLADSEIVIGDVFQSRISKLDMGDIGFLFIPAEIPPELLIGLPDDFESNSEAYYSEPENHAVGADYVIPGALLSLFDESTIFAVGLGGDELGYGVPISDYRLKCLDLALPGDAQCADLAERGVIANADYGTGEQCAEIADEPEALEALGDDGPAVEALCRYGQALGRELGEPSGHYEETNAIGWDLVNDLWAAAERLSGQ